MTKYKSFNDEKKKLNQLWTRKEEDSANEKDLKKITIKINPNSFSKQIVTIPIALNINLASPVDQNPGGGGGGNLVP